MENGLKIKEDFKTPENKEKLSLRVLVAEDNNVVREVIEEILKAKGYTVETVKNGQQLVDKLSDPSQKFDLVITDNQMPQKSGMEAIEEIRSNEKFRKLPIILMTGNYLREGDKKKLKENFNAEYLEKPFSEEGLLDLVERLTEKS